MDRITLFQIVVLSVIHGFNKLQHLAYKTIKEGKNVLIFGSESEGIREKTLSKADFKFKIKISNKIESLNISNSVSIVCHFIKNQIN